MVGAATNVLVLVEITEIITLTADTFATVIAMEDDETIERKTSVGMVTTNAVVGVCIV